MARFRESGIQSLRCLNDSEAYPIVAVRSSGLALESIIGFHQQFIKSESKDVIAKSLVSEAYLRMLLAVANERFKTNANRRDRFWTKLQELSTGHAGDLSSRRAGWEDPEVRRERKREEGLRRSRAAMGPKVARRKLDLFGDSMSEEGPQDDKPHMGIRQRHVGEPNVKFIKKKMGGRKGSSEETPILFIIVARMFLRPISL
ncbi:daomin protein [Histoplasma capsulatum H143]|uniref:tRNA(Phe) 7-[(3-amino-3-carboxypropyl)-4-demethylwyosine(37)-N(4)]-methyltransferase n=1 Tax=Ajellomyces capsulatus (strain H143) TaxID=544712 RepID=C6HRW3_AJECH|nr:daomin protein [Histoplasma capsulatum H143]